MNRGVHLIGLFLIYLVILFPIYGSFSVADIDHASVSGSDLVDGFRKGEDKTIVSVSISGDPITSISVNKFSNFNCEYNSSLRKGKCTTIVESGKIPFNAKKEYLIKLKQGADSFNETKYLVIDQSPPKINNFNITIKEEKVFLNYDIFDSIYGSTPNCSGFKELRVSADDVLKKTIKFSDNKCNKILSEEIDLGVEGTETKNVCIEIIDNSLQSSESCKDLTIDLSPPTIKLIELYKNNKKITYITDKLIDNVELRIILNEDSGIKNNETIIDASSLNPALKEQYSSLHVNCKKSDDEEYTCSMKNLIVLIMKENPELTVSFSDVNDHFVTEKYPLLVNVDKTSPEILEIYSSTEDSHGRYWLSPENNTIFMKIKENESGFYNKKIFFDLSSLGTQSFSDGKTGTMLRPNNCSEGWFCKWSNINVDKSIPHRTSLEVKVLLQSSDDAGNIFEGTVKEFLILDNETPKILKNELTYECPTAEQQFIWTLTVEDKDSGSPIIYYDPSDISLDYFNASVPCEETEENGIYTCVVEISNLPSFPIDNGKLNFAIEDLAGNKLETSYTEITNKPVEICEAVEGAPPNVIEIITPDETIPDSLDRKIASQIEAPILIDVKLEGKNNRVSVLEKNIESCSVINENSETPLGSIGEFYDLVPYNNSMAFINTRIMVSNNTNELDSITIGCNLSFIVRFGTKVYKEKEYDDFVMEIPLINSPIGYIDDEVLITLDDLRDEINDLGDKIDRWGKVNKAFSIICNIAYAVRYIVYGFLAIKAVMMGLQSVLGVIPQTKPVAKKIGEKGYWPLAMVQGFFVRMLYIPPGYGPVKPGLGTFFRLFCGFYTCKLTDSAKYLNVLKLFDAGETSNSGTKTYKVWGGKDDDTYGSNREILNVEGGTDFTFDEDDEEYVGKDVYKNADQPDNLAPIFGEYRFDPFKSMHTAKHTFCVPMILYNMQKLEQLKCLKYRCIKSRSEAGFDTSVCDTQYKERKCMYYDGAIYKVLDNTGSLAWRTSVNLYMNEALVMISATAAKVICNKACDEGFWSSQVTDGMEGFNYVLTFMFGLPFLPLIIWPFKSIASKGSMYFEIFKKDDVKWTDCYSYSEELPKHIIMGYIACDIPFATVLGIDMGEWLTHKNSWSFDIINKDIGDIDYCNNIEDLDDE